MVKRVLLPIHPPTCPPEPREPQSWWQRRWRPVREAEAQAAAIRRLIAEQDEIERP
jgi:hypothetical protein